MTDAASPPRTDRPNDAAALERLRRFGGAALLGKMIDLFLVAAPERIGRARQAAAAGDGEGAERALHSLKSSSAQLGAMHMQRLSEEGERRAHDGSLDGLVGLMSELEAELARVRDWLATARTEGAT